MIESRRHSGAVTCIIARTPSYSRARTKMAITGRKLDRERRCCSLIWRGQIKGGANDIDGIEVAWEIFVEIGSKSQEVSLVGGLVELSLPLYMLLARVVQNSHSLRVLWACAGGGSPARELHKVMVGNGISTSSPKQNACCSCDHRPVHGT